MDKALFLCTDNFSLEEVNVLIDVLKNKLDLIGTIKIRRNKSGFICYRIRISRKSHLRLKELVLPYFIKSMYYKLGIGNNE
jgi:hypothetical protein